MGRREKFGVSTSLSRHLNSRVPPGERFFKWRPVASDPALCSFILFVNKKRSQIQIQIYPQDLTFVCLVEETFDTSPFRRHDTENTA